MCATESILDDDGEEVCVGVPQYGSSDEDDAPPPPAAPSSVYDVNQIVSGLTREHLPPPPSIPHEVLRSPFDPTFCVRRVHHSQLTVAAFRHHVASKSPSPLIITGLGEHLQCGGGGMSVEALRAILPPDMGIPVRGRGTMAASDFFAALDAGESVYAADVPIARHFPWVHQLVQVPRYFAHCFSHRTRKSLSIALDTPALFCGGADSRSPLHVDQMCSNFWMLLAQGHKHWVAFHPDDAPLLSPTFDADDQIDRFPPLAALGPRAAAARRVEFVLAPNEILFVPRGTPHEVANLSATVSVSANFIDQSNLLETLAQGRAKLARRDEGSDRAANLRSILDGLDEIEWPSVEDDLAPEDHAPRPAEEMGVIFPVHSRIMYDRPVTLPPSRDKKR